MTIQRQIQQLMQYDGMLLLFPEQLCGNVILKVLPIAFCDNCC